MNNLRTLSSLIQQFFSDYLINQRRASEHTIASYRDCFSLLLHHAQRYYHKSAAAIELVELNVDFITAFLGHLETERRVCIRSRNQRLAAIRSFFHYIALFVPEHIDLIQQVLALPAKRYQRRLITYLVENEIECLLNAPDRDSWIGRRDYALMRLMVQTGLRVSEVTGLCCADLDLSAAPFVRCTGKGRKERCTPLTRPMATVLQTWIRENTFAKGCVLFPSSNGGMLSADAVQHIVGKHTSIASLGCPSLTQKRVSPHVLRHTAAMQLLEAGVDTTMIALWLGHESVETTQIYLESSVTAKEKLLDHLISIPGQRGRFAPNDRLLGFLRAL